VLSFLSKFFQLPGANANTWKGKYGLAYGNGADGLKLNIYIYIYIYTYREQMCLFFLWCFYPIRVHGLPLRDFAITPIGHTRIGTTPLDEWSTRRSALYLTTHNAHKRHISMQPAEFKPTIPATEQPQTHTLDRAANGTDNHVSRHVKMRLWRSKEPLANARELLLYRHSETDTFGGVPLPRSWISSFLASNL